MPSVPVEIRPPIPHSTRTAERAEISPTKRSGLTDGCTGFPQSRTEGGVSRLTHDLEAVTVRADTLLIVGIRFGTTGLDGHDVVVDGARCPLAAATDRIATKHNQTTTPVQVPIATGCDLTAACLTCTRAVRAVPTLHEVRADGVRTRA
jgi:hypothetical protein